jgi:flagellar hook-length control protein FliK
VLSVTSDLAVSASYPIAPPKPALPDPSQATNSFSALVDRNVSDDSTNAPEPQAPQRTSAADAPPTRDAPSSNANSPAQATRSGASNDSPADSGQPPPTSPAGGKSGGTPASNAKSATAKPSDSKSSDKTSGDSTPTADATDATDADATTTPVTAVIAVATAIPVVPQAATANAAPTPASNSTAPLAIAAAAIAASSSTAAAFAPPPVPAKGAGATASAAITVGVAATKIGGQAAADGTAAKTQDTPTDPTTAVDVALNAATAAPDATKGKTTTSFIASPSVQAKTSATGFTGATDSTATATTTTIPAASPTAAAPQPGVTAKADPSNPQAPTAPDTTVSATSQAAPAPASREHAAIDTSTSTQTSMTAADASAQAAAVVQQPPSSAAPTSAPPAFTVMAATGAPVPVSGLAVEIAASVQSGKTRFEVRLDPADLGRIDVRIDVDRDGQVTSHLTVEKPETLAILQQDAPQLQQALNDAGLKTGSGGLQFSLRDQSSSGQNNGNQTNGNAQQLVINEEDSVPAAIAGPSYGRMLGASGGIDIRV